MRTSPATAWRKMKVAEEFMTWADILAPSGKPQKGHVAAAAELLHAEPFKMKDLQEHRDGEFRPESSGAARGPRPQGIFKVSLGATIKKTDRVANAECLGWSPQQRQEAKDWLQVWADRFRALKATLEELDIGAGNGGPQDVARGIRSNEQRAVARGDDERKEETM